MKYTNENNILTVGLEGRIASDNVDDIEKELLKIIEENSHSSCIMDAINLEYVSSAGLRLILKIAKSEKDFEIKNASQDVYDIFDVTGLSSVLKISKKIRKISLEGLQMIGNGFFSEVYRIDKDTIVKVFIRTNDYKDVQRELDLAKQGFVLGLPTAISYDIVDADGKPGLVFEMLDCDSLRDAIIKQPERFDEFMKSYANLIHTINNTDIGKTKIPNAKEVALNKLEYIKNYIELEEYDKMKNLIEEIPNENMYVHGDCQIKNIMLNNGEFLLIDMDTLSFGAAIFELAPMYATYVAFGEVQKGSEGEFLGIPNDMPEHIFYTTMKYYFGEISEENFNKNIKKISLLSYMHMMWWKLNNDRDNKEDFEYMKGRFRETLPLVDSLNF